VVIGSGGDRSQVQYSELDLSVVHARIDSIPENAIIPNWLKDSLAQASTA